MRQNFFKTLEGVKIPLPVFFPDATLGFIRSLDSIDIQNTQTPGILVNTYHLFEKEELIKIHGGVKKFMNWQGAVISDSGGFQINTLGSKVTDLLTPEKSIAFQIQLKSDMVVVLDDFTPPGASFEVAKKTVENTIEWAKRSRSEFDKLTANKIHKPYILGVVQGGKYQDLREYCAKELVKIGFDGLGYGGWPINENKSFDFESALTIARNTPENYFLYGLGVGKPQDIVGLVKMGYNIFDCVLPTRDARHQRLYVYASDSLKEINVLKENFHSYLVPTKSVNAKDTGLVSKACDCLLCTNYTRSYLSYLFKTHNYMAGRLATIHNLRFYSILMEKLQETYGKAASYAYSPKSTKKFISGGRS